MNKNIQEGSGIVAAPPPPPEIRVRTMASDIDAVMKSGGVSVDPDTQGVSVQVPGLGQDTAHGADVVKEPMRINPRIVIVVGILGFLILLGVTAYLGYRAFGNLGQ